MRVYSYQGCGFFTSNVRGLTVALMCISSLGTPVHSAFHGLFTYKLVLSKFSIIRALQFTPFPGSLSKQYHYLLRIIKMQRINHVLLWYTVLNVNSYFDSERFCKLTRILMRGHDFINFSCGGASICMSIMLLISLFYYFILINTEEPSTPSLPPPPHRPLHNRNI